MPGIVELIETGSGMLAARGWGGRKWRVRVSVGTESVWDGKTVLELNGAMVAP